jgi:hypothetical protein
MKKETIENNFKYHAPKEGQVELYGKMRGNGKALVLFIEYNVPECREKSLAITKIEEAIMWANAGIARNGGSLDEFI